MTKPSKPESGCSNQRSDLLRNVRKFTSTFPVRLQYVVLQHRQYYTNTSKSV
jgi:hypothetical protein